MAAVRESVSTPCFPTLFITLFSWLHLSLFLILLACQYFFSLILLMAFNDLGATLLKLISRVFSQIILLGWTALNSGMSKERI